MYPLHIISASYGNDSIALIQWAHEQRLEHCYVLFMDTGWAASWWAGRVDNCEKWVRSLGFKPARTSSIGMEALVKEKMSWPRQGIQFCTTHLKIKPAEAWLDLHDPFGLAICLTGVRREESANRKNFKEYVSESPGHGGRAAWAPLVRHTEAERDALLAKAGFDPLPHRSMECSPCINSNRADLRRVADEPETIAKIARIEAQMGHTKAGKPRTMFRPYRYMGATGIHEIIRWAESEPGEFDLADGTGSGCDSGYCGT